MKKPSWFVGANDLSPEDHVRVQAAIQRYVDASISKTVNAPNSQTVEEVKRLYTLAYDLGCKGIAYMRDGSRQGVLVRESKPAETTVATTEKSKTYPIQPRPLVVAGATYRMGTPVGTAYITVNTTENGEPLEVFVNVGKAGTDAYAMAEGLGRIISLALRFTSHLSPMDRVKAIIAHVDGIGGARATGFGENRIKSLPDAISKVLMMHFGLRGQSTNVAANAQGKANGNGALHEQAIASQLPQTGPQLVEQVTQPTLAASVSSANYDICPECQEALFVHQEGCMHCLGCGHTRC